MTETGAMAEPPRYQAHKQVWALKIKAIRTAADVADSESESLGGGAMITPEEPGYAPFYVDQQYMSKHKPQVGGYYVVYKDGYKSWSPAAAFEEGYTRVTS